MVFLLGSEGLTNLVSGGQASWNQLDLNILLLIATQHR